MPDKVDPMCDRCRTVCRYQSMSVNEYLVHAFLERSYPDGGDHMELFALHCTYMHWTAACHG